MLRSVSEFSRGQRSDDYLSAAIDETGAFKLGDKFFYLL